jgi:hypothetical protein
MDDLGRGDTQPTRSVDLLDETIPQRFYRCADGWQQA